jgi:tRNA threonylcarbamoyladenosine biosynthesis protein TsaE
VASRLAPALRAGDLLALEGPLGAGKTVFVRGLAQGLGVDGSLVRSPTFVLHHVYGAPPRLHHLDLFRLGAGAVITLLDLDSLLDAAPVAVEWADLAELAAWRPLRLAMEIVDERRRRIEVVGADLAPPHLLAAWEAALRG